jgi:hypothetical protein
MIKSYVAFTDEIDDPSAAAAEISAQIADGITLLKNTVGIINCHTEFMETGALTAVCKALSFPVFGFTTSINGGGPAESSALGAGELFLTIMILTSDDISFELGVSDKISYGGDYTKALAPALGRRDRADTGSLAQTDKSENTQSGKSAGEKPSLVIAAVPTITVIPGDDLLRIFEKSFPGVPLFGGFSVDDSPRYNDNVFTIANSETYTDRAVFLKIYGDVSPVFFTASLSQDKVNPRSAVVTKSKGTEIFTLNGRPVTEYIESIGLGELLTETGVVTNFALIIKNDDDDDYYARAILRLTKENTLICGGDIPEGAVIHIGEFEKEDTIGAGREAARRAVNAGSGALLMISSISRANILGSDVYHGIETVRNLTGGMPFIMAYAAGEFNSTATDKGYKNRFNNQSFNACALK